MYRNDYRKTLPKGKSNTAENDKLATKGMVKDIVKGILHKDVEEKFAVLDLSVAQISGSTVTDLSTIGQGVTQQERVGDQLTLRRLHWSFKVVASTGGLLTGADAYDTVRVILFRWWGDSAAAAPVVADILKLGASNTDYTIANYNYDNKEKYKILSDFCHVVYNAPIYNGSAIAVEPGPGHVWIHREDIQKVGNPVVYYNNNANTGSGHVYVWYISDSAFSPHPTITYALALEYDDA